jgi:hypothetical protein
LQIIANNYGIVNPDSDVHARDYFDHSAHLLRLFSFFNFELTVSGKALWLAYHGRRAEVPWTGNYN